MRAERIQKTFIRLRQDTLQLAAGSFIFFVQLSTQSS